MCVGTWKGHRGSDRFVGLSAWSLDYGEEKEVPASQDP